MEQWEDFLDRKVTLIIDDPPSDYPVKKTGQLNKITNTHVILENNRKVEAILLKLIRRIEIFKE